MKIEPAKKHSIHLRLNEEQYSFLLNLAKTLDVGVSDVVRMLVNSTLYVTKKAEDIGDSIGKDIFEKQTMNVDTLEEPSADNKNISEHKL